MAGYQIFLLLSLCYTNGQRHSDKLRQPCGVQTRMDARAYSFHKMILSIPLQHILLEHYHAYEIHHSPYSLHLFSTTISPRNVLISVKPHTMEISLFSLMSIPAA